jgi:hypothetical protein
MSAAAGVVALIATALIPRPPRRSEAPAGERERPAHPARVRAAVGSEA